MLNRFRRIIHRTGVFRGDTDRQRPGGCGLRFPVVGIVRWVFRGGSSGISVRWSQRTPSSAVIGMTCRDGAAARSVTSLMVLALA